MKTKINCTKHLDAEHQQNWEKTRGVIEEKHLHLRKVHATLDRAELHLRAFGEQTEVHLLVHDQDARIVEAHAATGSLDKSISLAFERAELQLVETSPVGKSLAKGTPQIPKNKRAEVK